MNKSSVAYKVLEVIVSKLRPFVMKYKFHPLFIGAVSLILFQIHNALYCVVVRPNGDYRADLLRSMEDRVVGYHARLVEEQRYEGTTTLTVERKYSGDITADELFIIVIKNFEAMGYDKKKDSLGNERITYEQAVRRKEVYLFNGRYLYEISIKGNGQISIAGKDDSLIKVR